MGKGQETTCTGKEKPDEAHSGQGAVVKVIYGWYTDLRQVIKTQTSMCLETRTEFACPNAAGTCRSWSGLGMGQKQWLGKNGAKVCPLDMFLSVASGKVL